MTNSIRTLAVAVIRSGARILVERGHDSVRGHDYYRAIGGGVEFGERAVDAVAREWREEFGLTLEAPAFLGVLENLFTYEGRAGHEIVFAFTARVAEREVYDRNEFDGNDAEGVHHVALWVSLDELQGGSTPLYPTGLVDLLTSAPTT